MPDASWRVGFGLFAQSRVGRQQDSEHVPCCVTCDASPGRLRFIVYFRIYVAERKRNTYVRGGPARDPGPFLSARPAKRRCIPHEVVYDSRHGSRGQRLRRTAGPTTPTPSIGSLSQRPADHIPVPRNRQAQPSRSTRPRPRTPPRWTARTDSDILRRSSGMHCGSLHFYCKWKAKADAMSISACKSASKISAFRLCIIWWSVGFSIFLKAPPSAMSG